MTTASPPVTVWSAISNTSSSTPRTSGRRRPHIRNKKPQPRRQGKHDETILRWLHQHRCLSQRQIERLLHRSASTTQHILRRLYDRHWLNRTLFPGTLPGSSQILYSLDREGAAYLRQVGVKGVSSPPSPYASALFLQHTLALNDFRILLTQGCAGQGWQIDTWQTESQIKRRYDRVRLPDKPQPVALVPDGYFAIDEPGRGRSHFFLELDRGTMTRRRFREKVAAYVAYYRSGGYQQRYGAQGFRVLTVVASAGEGRVTNLAEISAGVAGIGRRFWFVSLSSLTTASVLHDPIWQIAGQAGTHCLFERGQRQ